MAKDKITELWSFMQNEGFTLPDKDEAAFRESMKDDNKKRKIYQALKQNNLTSDAEQDFVNNLAACYAPSSNGASQAGKKKGGMAFVPGFTGTGADYMTAARNGQTNIQQQASKMVQAGVEKNERERNKQRVGTAITDAELEAWNEGQGAGDVPAPLKPQPLTGESIVADNSERWDAEVEADGANLDKEFQDEIMPIIHQMEAEGEELLQKKVAAIMQRQKENKVWGQANTDEVNRALSDARRESVDYEVLIYNVQKAIGEHYAHEFDDVENMSDEEILEKQYKLEKKVQRYYDNLYKYLIAKSVPKDNAEYMLRNFINSSVLASMITMPNASDTQKQIMTEGMNQYDAPGWARVTSGALALAADGPIFSGYGAIGSELTTRLLTRYGTKALVRAGMEKAAVTAAEAIDRALMNKGMRVVSKVIPSTISFAGYGAVSYPVSTISQGQEYSFKEHLKKTGEEGLKGAVLGVYNGFVGEATSRLAGGAKLAAKGGSFVGEVGIFTGFDILEQHAAGVEWDQIDYGKTFLDQLAFIGGLKIQGAARSMPGRVERSFEAARQAQTWKAAPRQFISEFVMPDVRVHNGVILDKNDKDFFTDVDFRELRSIGIDGRRVSDVYDQFVHSRSKTGAVNEGAVEQLLNAYETAMNSKDVSANLKAKLRFLMENKISSEMPITCAYQVIPAREGGYALQTFGLQNELLRIEYYDTEAEANRAARQQDLERVSIVGKTLATVRVVDQAIAMQNAEIVCKEAGIGAQEFVDASMKSPETRTAAEAELIKRYGEKYKELKESGKLYQSVEEQYESIDKVLNMAINGEELTNEAVFSAFNSLEEVTKRGEEVAARSLLKEWEAGSYQPDALGEAAAWAAERIHSERGNVLEVTLSDGTKAHLVKGDIYDAESPLIVKRESGEVIQTNSDPENANVHVDATAPVEVLTPDEAVTRRARARGIEDLQPGHVVTLMNGNDPKTAGPDGKMKVMRGVVVSADKETDTIIVEVTDEAGNPMGPESRNVMTYAEAKEMISTADYGKCLYVEDEAGKPYMVCEFQDGRSVLCYINGEVVKAYESHEALMADGYMEIADQREAMPGADAPGTGTGTGTGTGAAPAGEAAGTGATPAGPSADASGTGAAPAGEAAGTGTGTGTGRSALDRIPMKNGKRDYSAGTVNDVADAFVEKAKGGSPEQKIANAKKVAASQLKFAEADLAKAVAKREKGATDQRDPDAMFAAEEAMDQQVAAMEKVRDHWKAVYDELERRERDPELMLAREEAASREEAAKIMGPENKRVSTEEMVFWRDMANSLGVKFGIAAGMEGAAGTFEGDKMELWMKSEYAQHSKIWRNYIGHEFTHALRWNSGRGQEELWKIYRDHVEAAMGSEAFEAACESVHRLYTDLYEQIYKRDITREEIEEEVCCDFAGKHLFEKDPARVKVLVDRVNAHGRDARGFVRSTIDALKNLYTKLKQQFGARDPQLAEVEAAIKTWESMYEYAVATARESKAEAPSGKPEGTVPDIVNDKPADGRKRGYVMVNGVRYDRQGRLGSVEGKETRAIFGTRPEDTKNGHFALVELDDVQESHKGNSRNPLHFIPEAQPKDRTSGSSKAAAVDLSNPEKFDPALLTGDGVVYVEAAPVVNERGEVIQGNGRVMILREAFGNDASRERYIQYLKDNAERFGLKPEDIDKMKNPVLVNKLSVDDAEAIRLGQLDEKNMTSGGTERIKTANARKLAGDKMGNFVNRLMRDAGEDSSLAELVDKNGADALYYLMQIGAITPTQYETAVKDGKLTAEGKNDINDLLKEDLFNGAPEALKGQFEKLPAKVQRELVSALGGEMTAKKGYGLMDELRQSIQAYSELMGNEAFQRAHTYDDAKKAIEMWKREGNMFDQVSNAERYSDTALDFAAMFKGDNQKTVQEYFRKYYSIANGTFGEQASMFSEYEQGKTYSKAEALSGARRFKIGPVKREMDQEIAKDLGRRYGEFREMLSDGIEYDIRHGETPDMTMLFVANPSYENMMEEVSYWGVMKEMLGAAGKFKTAKEFAEYAQKDKMAFEIPIRDFVDRQIKEKYGLRRTEGEEEGGMLSPLKAYYQAKKELAFVKENIEPHYAEYQDENGQWKAEVYEAAWEEARKVKKDGEGFSGYLDFFNSLRKAHLLIESSDEAKRLYESFVEAKKLGWVRIRKEEEKNAPYPFEQMADGTFYFGEFPKFKAEKPANSLADENNVVRISTPTDKNLVAVHNINEKSLGKAIELGGFAMPSIAVTKAELGHEDFGDISLLFSKETINPTDRRNVLWDRDSWSPTFPEVQKKLSEKVLVAASQRLEELVPLDKRVSRIDVDESNLYDTLRRFDWDAADAFANNAGMKQAYLASMGKNVRLPMREKTYSHHSNSLLQKIIDLSNETGIDLSNSRVFFEADENPAYKAVVDRVKEIVLDDRIEKNSKRIAANPEIERVMRERYDMSFSEFDNLVYDAYRMKRDMAANGGKIPQIVDAAAAAEDIDKKVSSTNKKYREWITNLFDGIVEKEGIRNERDIFTPSGNRRSFEQTHDPVTLHNVVAAMMREAERGGKGFFGSNIFGASANKFGSISEMKSQSDRLQRIDKEENRAIEKSFTEEFAEIAHHVTSDGIGDAFDFRQALTEAVAKTHDAKGIYKELHPYWKKFTMADAEKVEDIVNRIGQMAVDYFEAKPNRAVSLNEVKAAVVPKGTDKSLVAKLKQEGIKVVTYDKNVEGARVKAVDKAATKQNIKFKVDEEYAQAVESGDVEKVQDMLAEEALAKGYISNDEYRMSHRAPNNNGFNRPLHDVVGVYPEDVYSNEGLIYYGYEGELNRESWNVMRKVRNNPDALVTIYRTVPIDVKETEVRNGDWITTSRAYAEEHRHHINGRTRIIEQKVPAKYVWTNGDSLSEYGYDDGKTYAHKNTKNGRKLLEPTYDDNGNLIPLSKRFNTKNGDIRFKIDEKTPIFVSNAAEAVKGIKQEKAPASQWLAMLEKAGGLKAGEDKWLGLRAWLGEQAVDALAGKRDKNITKDEILDYIAKNDIRIEEVKYEETSDSFEDLKKEYDRILREEGYDAAWDYLYEKYGEEASHAFDDLGGELVINEADTAASILKTNKAINSTRLEYTTEGLENKKEIALTVPTIEPYNENDDVHFGDAGGGRAVAWVRFGDATSANADGTVAKVLVIDEIQSKRHQDGREKGYVDEELEKRYAEALDKRLAVRKHIISKYDLDGGSLDEEILSNPNVSETDKAGLRLAKEEWDNVRAEYKQKGNGVVPDAPFDKNWHELAMKRMLRYAAENGYDKVAWTTGMQQSKRYNIGGIVESIESGISVDGERMTDINMTDGTTTVIYHDDEGNILKVHGQNLFEGAKNISEVVGKETADKILSQTERGTSGIKSYNADNLEIGGNGMKSFYDKMLPSFMNKYGKKWGVKVGEVELDLPNEGDRKMWSVDVNDAMKGDVMRGQKKFALKKYDREGNEIGDGSNHESYEVIDFSKDYPQINSRVSKSNTSESVYVTYSANGKTAKVRFSTHNNNATRLGEEIVGRKGSPLTPYEVLEKLGLIETKVEPKMIPTIKTRDIAQKNLENYEEADLTLDELKALPIGSDISEYVGKRAKGSNKLIEGDVVGEREDGRFKYYNVDGEWKSAAELLANPSDKSEGTGGTRYAMEDIQGNPLNQDGTLKVEKISSIDEITDEDFTAPTRNIELPKLPKNVDEAIGAKGKPVVIKKNIFEKNWKSHKFPFEESRAILKAALYDTDLIGQTQPTTKPMHWVAIKLDDKSPIVILEVNDGKYNTEIVGWYTLDERNLERIKRQADKNGGELVILSSKDRVGSLSTPLTGLSSGGKNTQNNSLVQENGGEILPGEKSPGTGVGPDGGMKFKAEGPEADASGTGATEEQLRARQPMGPKDILARHFANMENKLDNVHREEDMQRYTNLIVNDMKETLAKLKQRHDAGQEYLFQRNVEGAKMNIERGMKRLVWKSAQMEASWRKSVQEEMERFVSNIITGMGGADQTTVREIMRNLSHTQRVKNMDDVRLIAHNIFDAVLRGRERKLKETIDGQLKLRGTGTSKNGGNAMKEVDERHQKTIEGLRKRIDAKMEAPELEREKEDINKEISAIGKLPEEMTETEKQRYSELERKMNEIALYERYKEAVDAYDAELRGLYDDLSKAKTQSARAAIRESIIESEAAKVKAMNDFSVMLKEYTKEGREGKHDFLEGKEMERQKIRYAVLSDLKGVKASPYNPGHVGFGAWSTLNGVMKALGRHSSSGRGRLWQIFIPEHENAVRTQQVGLEQANKMLNDIANKASVKEFGRQVKFKDWASMGKWATENYADIQKTMAVEDENGNAVMNEDGTVKTKTVVEKMPINTILYIHACEKMSDGRAKLRAMGITEESVAEMREMMRQDPVLKQFIDAIDEVQDKVLPKLKEKYNLTHKKLFGVGMADVEDYFPIHLDKDSYNENIDIGVTKAANMPSTMTGAIKKRTKNSLPLDLTNYGAFDVVLHHILQMEQWNAFAPLREKSNMLLNDLTLKRKINSVYDLYGSGKALYKTLENNLMIACGLYRPKQSRLTKFFMALKSGLVARNVAFNLNTARKQLTSIFAAFGNADPMSVIASIGNSVGSIRWAWRELPDVRARLEQGDMGYAELQKELQDDKGIFYLIDKARALGRSGFNPNKWVDMAVCCAVAKSCYESQKRFYKKVGLSEEKASERAKMDASIAYNESQQSSQGAYMSELQSERSFGAAMATVYRNSPMSYGRMIWDSVRNIKRQLTDRKGILHQSSQMWEERGLTPEQAMKAAKKEYTRDFIKNVATILSVHAMNTAWYNSPNMIYYLLGQDDDKKKEMAENAQWLALVDDVVQGIPVVGPAASIIATNIMRGGALSSIYKEFRSEHDWKIFKGVIDDIFAGDLLLDDVEEVGKAVFSGEVVKMVNSGINHFGSILTGTSPKLIANAVNGVVQACHMEAEPSMKFWFGLMAIMSHPRDAKDQLFVDMALQALGDDYAEAVEASKDGKVKTKAFAIDNEAYEEVLKAYIEYCQGRDMGFYNLTKKDVPFLEEEEGNTDDPFFLDQKYTAAKSEENAMKRLEKLIKARNKIHAKGGSEEE